MSKSVKWQIVAALVIALIVIAGAVYVNGNNSRIDRQAYELTAEAKQAIGQTSTADDVRKWLQANDWYIPTDLRGNWITGYYDKDAGPQAKPEYLIVRAYKQLGLDDNIPGDRWISLAFRFNPDQMFISVFLDKHAPQPKGSSQ